SLRPRYVTGLAYGFDRVWLLAQSGDHEHGLVYRLDPQTGKTIAAVKVGHYPQALTFAGGRVWVADRQDGAVRELDPTTNRVVGTPLHVSREPASQGRALGDLLWIGTGKDGKIWLYDPNHDRVA